MILLVIALVGVSGYAVTVSYGPMLWSQNAGTVAFAAASLAVFSALVSRDAVLASHTRRRIRSPEFYTLTQRYYG